MPHANDGSMHQYRRPTAGLLFIPESLTFKPTDEANDHLIDDIIEAMTKPIVSPRELPIVLRCTEEEFRQIVMIDL